MRDDIIELHLTTSYHIETFINVYVHLGLPELHNPSLVENPVNGKIIIRACIHTHNRNNSTAPHGLGAHLNDFHCSFLSVYNGTCFFKNAPVRLHSNSINGYVGTATFGHVINL